MTDPRPPPVRSDERAEECQRLSRKAGPWESAQPFRPVPCRAEQPTTNRYGGNDMNHTDRLAPLIAGVLIVALIVAGLVSAAADLSARLNGLAL